MSGFAVTTISPAGVGQGAPAGYQWVSDERIPDQLSEPNRHFLGHLLTPADVLLDGDGDGLQPLPASLRAHARGIYVLEAAVDLLIAHQRWLDPDDFTRRFVELAAG